MTASLNSVSLKTLTLQSLKIGCLGFGGPAGQIALMHRAYVDNKKWVSEAQYLHALNYCMLLPGPEAQQLAVYVGWLTRGVIGGMIAGALFVIPGAIFIFGLAWLYAANADLPLVASLFFGVKAAVLAIVAEALIKIGKRAFKTNSDFLIAFSAFVALYFLGVPFPLVILAAAFLGVLRAVGDGPLLMKPDQQSIAQPSKRKTFVAAMLWALLWLMPLAISWLVLGGDHIVTQTGRLFSELAVVTFGGAYAVLAYLQQQAVDVHGWLTAAQMIDGLGLAETTPGPLVLVNQFVGFLSGWNMSGNLGLAAACALMASWCTFAPSYLWIFAGAPFAEGLRQNQYAAAALQAITAAVLGVVTNLAIWFGFHVIFRRTTEINTPWGHDIVLPSLTHVDPAALILAMLAGIALIRFKVNMIVVILFCAVLGGVAFSLR